MKKISLFLLISLVAVSCGPLGKYKQEPTIVDNAPGMYGDDVLTSDPAFNVAKVSYRNFFKDSILVGLIDSALVHNFDLAQAMENIKLADISIKSAKLGWLPNLGLAPDIAGNYASGSAPYYNYNLAATASWELDIFGRHATNIKSAKAAREQAEDYRQAVQTSVVSSVANTYYTLMMLDEELATTVGMERVWSKMVNTIMILKREGFADQVAVNQYQATYDGIVIKIAILKGQIGKAENAMSLLLGKGPSHFKRGKLYSQNEPESMEIGVPVQMLQLRPDVRAAQRQCEIAFYTTKSAWLNFFPKLTISADGVLTNIIGLTQPISSLANVAATLTQPILTAGANWTKLKNAQIQQEKARIALSQSIVTAANEVSDALHQRKTCRVNAGFYRNQVLCLTEAFQQTKMLVENSEGKTYLDVLTAHNALMEAEYSYISNKAQELQAAVGLYSALGGGAI